MKSTTNCRGALCDNPLKEILSSETSANDIPLFAPVPVSHQTPMLYEQFYDNCCASLGGPQVSMQRFALQTPEIDMTHERPVRVDSPSVEINFEYNAEEELVSECAIGISRHTFPTPSELLAELGPGSGPNSSSDELGSDVKSETARKARRRAMAERVGFLPTDPDTISSHDKKRHYLECLEQYIMYLHHQFELIHATPPPIARVASYRGLTSRSIRTLLVHMEHTTRQLNQRTLAEEQRFMNLSDSIYRRGG